MTFVPLKIVGKCVADDETLFQNIARIAVALDVSMGVLVADLPPKEKA